MSKNIILFITLLIISLVEVYVVISFWKKAKRQVKTVFFIVLFLLWLWPVTILYLYLNLSGWGNSSLLLELNLAAIALLAPLFGLFTYYFTQDWQKRFSSFRSYNSDDVVERINSILKTEKMNLTRMVSGIMKVLYDVFLPKKVLFFLVEKDEQCMVPYQQIGLDLPVERKNEFFNIGKFCAESEFFNYLKRRKSVIDISNLKMSCYRDSQEDCRMVAELAKLSVSLVIPVHGSQGLVGCLFLDNKRNGEVYDPHDFNLLEILAGQIASHLENARLYAGLQEFNEILQKRVKKATFKLQETNRKLIETIDAKNEFISIVAHQLRAPLTVTKGYLSMLYEGTMGELSEKQMSAVVKVYRGNDDLIDMVENLLNFSRIKDGRIRYNFEKVHLDEIVKSVLEQFEIHIKGRKLKIDIKKDPKHLPLAMGDFNKLRNVVSNLLDNTIKYTNDGDKISISITANDTDIIFEITDNGVGMVPADAEHLFEKFFRNEEMSFKRIQGTGLGLYVVDRFIAAHKGKVWASSPGRGKGSTFGFSLPR